MKVEAKEAERFIAEVRELAVAFEWTCYAWFNSDEESIMIHLLQPEDEEDEMRTSEVREGIQR